MTSAITFVAEEAKIGGLLHRALAYIEGGQPLLELAAHHFASKHNQKAVGAIRRLLSEAPIQEKWAAELRATDYALLNAHSLVAIWDALETCIEDTVVAILAKNPAAPNDDEELRKLFRKSKDTVRVDYDVIQTQEQLLQLYGLSADCPQHKDTLLMTNSLRNALVHRAGFIDSKAVRQAPMLASRRGQKCTISRDLYMKCHQSISDRLVVLLVSITSSKYVVAGS